jgi:5-methylthioadenosine/S-adenosylhomocysteine deaminase
MHLSQTRGERTRVLRRERKSPVKFAESCGALTERSLVVHLTSADEQDIKRIAGSGATIGFCPASQMIFERLAPLKLFAKYNIPLALATDCAPSNDGADLFAEMKLFGLISKHLKIKQSDYVSPRSIFKSVTETPAKALGLSKKTGTLAIGKAADIVFVKKDLIGAGTWDTLTNLIYSVGSRNVDHVMINGKFALWNKKLVQANESDLREEYVEAVTAIHKKIGLKRQSEL